MLESTLEIPSLSISALWLARKKLISLIIDFRALLLRERIWHTKFDKVNVIGQFLS